MLAEYKDIRDAMNQLLRTIHEDFAGEYTSYPTGCTGEVSGACQCVVEPLWYDEHGVPRYAEHSPALCSDIYADEVALLEIACQACERTFRVQMSAVAGDALLRAHVWAHRLGTKVTDTVARELATETIARRIQDGTIHFGDPPRHDQAGPAGGACLSGDTMNCDNLQVVEYWRRDRETRSWERVPELEKHLLLDDGHIRDCGNGGSDPLDCSPACVKAAIGVAVPR